MHCSHHTCLDTSTLFQCHICIPRPSIFPALLRLLAARPCGLDIILLRHFLVLQLIFHVHFISLEPDVHGIQPRQIRNKISPPSGLACKVLINVAVLEASCLVGGKRCAWHGGSERFQPPSPPWNSARSFWRSLPLCKGRFAVHGCPPYLEAQVKDAAETADANNGGDQLRWEEYAAVTA
jgi:hypothetical protein